MEGMNRFDKKLDIVNKLLNLSFKLGVIAGGAVVLFGSLPFCVEISFQPLLVKVPETDFLASA